MKLTMEKVNEMTRKQFVEQVGWVFEHSPWVAEHSFDEHPFQSLEQMYKSMVGHMYAANQSLQLQLLNAHPDLGTRIEVSPSSENEQKNAGLHQLTEVEFQEFSVLNQTYINKFGFPFILAVKGHDKSSIKARMILRIENDVDSELETALKEVRKIVKFRLWELISDQYIESKMAEEGA
ncbi:2-oxo-4-hydroxy-4-carboxy-5-ureidoimidazoline decarboxylase [Halalkalibacter akibai]|uniref:2-oxo-4-hydroxy-4-carboxy-5-ureidoimidazoline decarboxylase n=1 Tax=Halalkalibacter akibai (strain ATCC 43226 / DSM 21942 / CIP 109018 / JCM 9157 / 1139) TaxID=1236973 RepID=W4R0G2_HALA3|nr:2-oxo-4-hydroxy-4-carboxy-5-ureidoimidazoline decarboxylase [Halalkalibacter akibai]GAE37039.1 2-oxo-4-hydroxy-4-carboxy-5-ureidoimidazoline (OHCU) decarboxylase [Halalkalibacter akibai JCM 9157]